MKKNYSHSYLICFLFFLLSLNTEVANASHSMGSDLTYHCLGGNTYEIQLSFYRDCAGIDADTGGYIVFQSSCYPADSVLIYQIAATGQEISPVCPSNTTTCNGGTFTGIQEYIYRGQITLPGPCADWQFSYNLCCRNNAITNILNPGGTQMYIYATLNNTITPCNNSPTFSNKPVPFACLGQQFCYNHGAYDQDGDSLSYSLLTPYNSAGTPITYLSPWDANNPLSSSPAVNLNPLTGDICMTPTNLEITVMAVLVHEYRNGVLIGTVERDIQITVINCSNVIPTMTGIDGTNNFTQTICAGTQTCFSLYSADADGAQNTFVTWDNSIPNAVFTTLPGGRENATFCWTPTEAQISANPYCFTVTVRDDNCPYVGNQIYSYCITVTGVLANAGPDLSVGCNITTPITATASGGTGVYTYQWNTGATTPTIISGPGSYVVSISDGRCIDSDTTNVAPGTATPAAAFNAVYNCSGLNVQFTDQTTIAGGSISSYLWTFGDGNSSNAQNPLHVYSATGNYTVTMIATSAGGCIDSVTQLLHLSLNQPNAIYTLANGCSGTQINFTDHSTSPTAITNWSWDFGDGTTSTVPSPAHIYTLAGNYTINLIITNTDGCKDSIIHTTIVYPIPIANAGINDTICEGTIGYLNASGGNTYLWNPVGLTTASIAINSTQSQTYVVTVTSIFGCTATDAASIVVIRLPQVSLQNRSICIGASTTLTANILGGGGFGGNNGPYTYWWAVSGATTQQVIVSPVSTTTYVAFAINRYGCQNSDTANVQVNNLPVTITSAIDALCFGTATGSVSVQSTSTVGPYSYLWSPSGAATSTANNLSSGMNYVTITDGNGCRSDDSIFVFQPNTIQLTMDSIATTCFASTNGSTSVTAIGGVANYSYLWNPSGGTNSTATGLSAGNYNVTVTDNNGCSQNKTVIVSQPSVLQLQMNATSTSCNNGQDGVADVIVAGGTSGYNYLWAPNGGTNSQASNLTTGNYTVTVTDANGCTSSNSILVNQPSALVLNTGTTPATCNVSDGTATINTTGGTPNYSYLWTPGNILTQNALNLAAGVYDVRVTDSKGCTATVTATVGVTGGPVITAVPIGNVNCFGGNDGSANVNIASGIAPFTFLWTPGNFINQNESTLSANHYSVAVTDANGCIVIDTMTIYQPTDIIANANSNPTSCFGFIDGSISSSANGGVGPYTFSWSPIGGNTAIASSLPADTYTVTVTDLHGCTKTASTIVAQPTGINLLLNTIPVTCFGISNGSANVFASGGVGTFTYQWSPSGGNTDIAVNLASGNYTVVVTDMNGCITTYSIFVDQPDLLFSNANSLPVSCYGGNTGSAIAIVNGGTPNYNYTWSPYGGTGATADSLGAGSFTVTVTDVNGCSSTSTTVVAQSTPLVLDVATVPTICIGQSIDLLANVNGGVGPYHLIWNTSDTTSIISVSPNLTSSYTVIGIDANNCTTDPVSVTVNVYPPLNISTNAHPPICLGTTAQLYSGATGGNGGPYTYTWNGGTIFGPTPSVAPTNDSTFIVLVSDGCSPLVADTIQLIVYPLPLVDFTPHVIYGCTPVNVNFHNYYPVDSSSLFYWDLQDNAFSNDSNPTHNYINPGEYDITLTIVSPNGCSDSYSVNNAVTVFPYPVADFLQSADQVSVFYPEITFTDNSTNAVAWEWNFGDGSSLSDVLQPTHSYGDTGTYNVQLITTSIGGCVDTTYGVVRIEPEFTLFIPNSFTPNGDGTNDTFFANGVGFIDYEMWIMDRWGKEIFHSTNQDQHWDGTYYYNDSTCQNDVYEYIVIVHDYKAKQHKLIGHVTLVR